jgi:lactate 2-monooxygenase
MASTNIAQSPWSGYMVSVYRGRQGTQPLGTVDFEEIEAKAKEKLKDYPGRRFSYRRVDTSSPGTPRTGAYMYARGSAGTNSTYKANVRAFEKYRIVPRMLVDATTRSLEVCLTVP